MLVKFERVCFLVTVFAAYEAAAQKNHAFDSLDVLRMQDNVTDRQETGNGSEVPLSKRMTTIDLTIFITTALSILDAAIISTNLIVIITVIITRQLHTISNYLIASLAVADLLIGLFVLPTEITVNHFGYWPFDMNWLCEMWISFTIFTCHGSILNLCCISIDRYIIIVHPRFTDLLHSAGTAVAVIALCWSLPILTVSIALIGPVGHVANSRECRASLGLPFRVYSIVVCFVLPLVLLVFIYCRVVGVIKHRLKNSSPSYGQQANPLHSTDKSSTWTYDSCRKAPNEINSVNRPKHVFLNHPTSTHFLRSNRAQVSQKRHKINESLRHSTANEHHTVRLGRYSPVTMTTLKSYLGRHQPNSSYAEHQQQVSRLEEIGEPHNRMSRCFNPQSESFKRSENLNVFPQDFNGHNTLLSEPQRERKVTSLYMQVRKSSSMNLGEVKYSVSKRKNILVKSVTLACFAELKNDQLAENPQVTKLLGITKAKRRRRAKQNMRAVRMVTAVVVCYFAFWLPFFVCFIAEIFIGEIREEITRYVNIVGFANSVCNPFIYALLDRRYSSAYARILNCKATR
ncbi:5-hydroxytryptamine receptor 1D [Clonorchis sinensis]|uniref:5-hydroxytryptamine receptor 1D n=1 Tax=Clonorchis sinensis TaxID=79923 RepID=A0A3R7DD48_CLOSI|nr:5-hydroxytryptamine receptor 1D [Clonorchis sinensis]